MNENDLFFTCSLIEFIGRKKKLKRIEVVHALGTDNISRIYRHADVLHCEPIEKNADEFCKIADIVSGSFDNIADCKYTPPDYWAIGRVYSNLIQDVQRGSTIQTLLEVYSSWINDAISNYNSDFFYQSRDYIRESYFAGTPL